MVFIAIGWESVHSHGRRSSPGLFTCYADKLFYGYIFLLLIYYYYYIDTVLENKCSRTSESENNLVGLAQGLQLPLDTEALKMSYALLQ